MTDQKHENLRRLFDGALTMPKEQRAAFLARECGTDVELLTRLLAMLKVAEDDVFLTSPTGGALNVANSNSDSLREGPGSLIGPYKLLQQIGEGGFGVVFLAEQSKPVARKVALKIIKLGMDTRQVVARFEQERQALAMMDHPNIARVLDAGATETGRPYFVMELVKGAPIAEYCDKNNLTIDERLEVFEQVCNAVQHAHTKGIIHRDIKPSNVLVATQDGRPHAKVIDFGIAKATLAKLTDKTLFTEIRQVIGTLQYMSPEQAHGSLDIDTRTDVYSLGVVLYELLTGSTPFDSKTLRDAFHSEIQRMIREVEPPKPSTRLHQSADTLASIAAHRRIEPKRLGAIVRGELDWIVMKALEKDRARRYESANSLALDVRRYLNGDAVVAAPPSNAYRLKKFVRRNRVPVAAGALVVIAILVGAGLAVAGFVQASRQRDLAVAAETRALAEANRAIRAEEQAVAEAKRASKAEAEALGESQRAASAEKSARTEAKRSGQIATFLTSILEGVGPQAALGRDTQLLREILDNTAERVEKELVDQPAVASDLLRTVTIVYNDLAVYDKAEKTARRSLDLLNAAPGDNRGARARGLHELARVLESTGRYDLAKQTFQEAFDTYTEAGLGDTRQGIAALNGVAGVMFRQDDLVSAEPIFRRVLEAQRRFAAGSDNHNLASALDRLGVLLASRKPRQLAESESLAREALAMRRRLFGEIHPDVALSLTNLAFVLSDQNHHDEAIELGTQALAQHRKLFGERHPRTASGMETLGTIYERGQRLPEAIELWRTSLEIRKEKLGKDHRDTLNSEFILASALDRAHDYVGAEEHYRAMLDWGRANYPAGDNRTSAVIVLVANAVMNQKRYADAEALHREALDARIANRPAGHTQIFESRNAVADCLVAQSRHADAERLLVANAQDALDPNVSKALRDASSKRIEDFYAAWHAADPSQDFESRGAEWKAKLAAVVAAPPKPQPASK